jgi:hypothetical protein
MNNLTSKEWMVIEASEEDFPNDPFGNKGDIFWEVDISSPFYHKTNSYAKIRKRGNHGYWFYGHEGPLV